MACFIGCLNTMRFVGLPSLSGMRQHSLAWSEVSKGVELFVVRCLFTYDEGWNNGVIVNRETKEPKIEGNGMV